MEAADHDLLIGLRSEIVALRMVVEAHNISSVQRDTRIETKVDRINGTVALHDAALIKHAQVEHSNVSPAASEKMIGRLDEMWTAWSIGKWVGAAGLVALLAQTAALLLLIVKGGTP